MNNRISHAILTVSSKEVKDKQVPRHLALRLVLTTLIGSAMAFSGKCGPVYRHHFAIPAGSLNDALLAFAAEARLEILFSADMVRGMISGNLSGEMTIEQALKHLLQDSNLDYRFLDADTITLTRHATEAPTLSVVPPDHVHELAAINVIGRAVNRLSPAFDWQATDDNPHHYHARNVTTATRTDTPVKQIPQSIQTLKRSLIDDQMNITVSESLYNVSGVVPRNPLFTPVIEATLVRGFRAEQLLDGFTQYYNPGDRESTINLERIEVLKGGNAVFYSGGSGSPVGGVINLISKLPGDKAFGKFGFTAGSHDFYQPYFDYNQPLNDKLGFRINGEYTDAGSHIDHIDTRRFNINPTLSLVLGDATSVILQGKISRWRQPDYQGLPATGTIDGGFVIQPSTFIGPQNIDASHSDSDSATVSIQHRVNSHWRLNLKGRHATSEFDQLVQSLYGLDGFVADRPLLAPSNWALINAQLFQRQREHSLQAYSVGQFNIGASEHNLLLGADYSRLTDDGFITADFGPLNLGVGSIDLSQPTFPTAYNVPATSLNKPRVENTTYGGYLQWQSSWFQCFHPLVGLRLAGMEIDYVDRATQVDANTQALKPLPRAGATIDLTRELSLFAGYSEGMRGQPFVQFSGAPLPELANQLEAGFKFDIDDQLTGQIAVYRINRSQVAVTDTAGPPGSVIAAGQQRSQGVEADFTWHPSEALGFLVNYAHTDAEFVDALAGVAKGNRPAMVPSDSGRFWASYRPQFAELEGFSFGFGVYLRSAAFLSNDNRFQTPGYHSLDAAIAYEHQGVKLQLSAKNLSDEQYFLPYGYFGGRVAPSGGPLVFISAAVTF